MHATAFTLMYVTHATALEAYVMRIVRDRHSARDLVHDTLLKAFERSRANDGEEPGAPWLFRVARNAAVDHLRKSSRARPEDPDAIDRRREGSSPPLEWGSATGVHAEIARLPKAQREVTLLRYRTGLTANETAAALGKTPAAVRQLELRALRTLRSCLDSG